LSKDGRNGLTIIAFIGSVFSPYYAWARRHGRNNPLDHCALNVALYSMRRKHWTMTERSAASTMRTASSLTIGPSMLTWHGDVLTIRFEEISAPIPKRLRGIVRVYPKALTDQTISLDLAGRHRWSPIAPCSHVEVSIEQPTLRWQGPGYLDINHGDEPIENAFRSWHWSRGDLRGRTAVLYDIIHRDGPRRPLALAFGPSGSIADFEPPPLVSLPPTRWKIARATRADAAESVTVRRTLESAPFYARSLISTRLLGQHTWAMHESLSLDRFQSSWVQAILPFRMPRALR
jgi:carotenoid 1,2-hydratase